MVTAIIAAGGRGARMGGDRPKQLLSLGGATILQRSVAAFDRCDRVDEIMLVVPPDLAADPSLVSTPGGTPLRVVAGGRRRQDSVAIGFDASSDSSEIVVIHDAARPLCSPELIVRTVDAAFRHGAAIAALPAHDTVKQRASGDDQFVGRTLARQSIVLAQTPQAFRREVLAEAIRFGRQGEIATDEAVLAERAGYRVALVEGDPRNIKITTEGDLSIAKRLLEDTMSTERVGFGYDLHRFVEGRPLVLGGVHIPHDRGLAGHSDADAVCHAAADAILGAAAAGDIGRHFPDTDPRWEGVSSIDLLREIVDLVRSRGFVVVNLDVVVVAEQPKIGPHADRMREALAPAVGIDCDAVSIKGKTNEGMDATGRGEAIAAHAVAMVRAVDD
ncbi:MAG: 2-C-methyl-D-erythritol 2,4-cyclodiphosphate synthase [Vicinamibacterales bacterium]|nr:2-C-methyl-D-erythritol 2,4-cyclodiphosphate synthase [Vicinamibacterales bacterium]MDP7691636.1 2-C-methyl-D-erythritol 2,4-cyclodiphosphate synthase [Vicinamibacterales bacterium]HJN43263.1 2-C-methyl-D-erythritol 2,4-cyclodiphosphate synthase [Vicinamibacterales bacterium]